MNRISVGRCVARAYGFLFGRFFTVVSVSWVAAVVFAGLRLALFRIGPVPHPIIEHWQPASLHFAGLLGALLLFSAIAIPLTRAALGQREEWALAQFVIGAREVRLFFAILRIYVVVIALIALCVAAVFGTEIGMKAVLTNWQPAAGAGLPLAEIARDVVIALGVLVTVFVSLRLSFLLYPVAAAEPHASLRRAWSLSAGNFLRILAVVLAVFVPVYVLVFGAEYALMGPALIDGVRGLFASATPDAKPLAALFMAHAQVISIGAGVLLTVLAALGAGASAAAYLALTGVDEAAVVVEEVFVEPAAPEVHAQAPAEPAEAHEPVEEDHGTAEQDHEEHGEAAYERAEPEPDASHHAADVAPDGRQEDVVSQHPDEHGADDAHASDEGVGHQEEHGHEAPAPVDSHPGDAPDDANVQAAPDADLPPHQPGEADSAAHDKVLERTEAERVPEHA